MEKTTLMKTCIYSRKKPATINVKIITDDNLGFAMVEEIAQMVRNENRRRVHGGGEGIGYSVELISSRNP